MRIRQTNTAKIGFTMSCIGTAGHVDHGKSALVTALTGMDPDRLAEEKARGMTIDLGFAWLTLPSGREASVVDVPGHESFIKNMLAGVGGIDVALLVVAADEGVMPQTREHLAILDLLQVQTGVVALTKCDLVDDPDWLELVREEVAELLKPTSLSSAPIIPCSAVTGSGLPQLLAALDSALATQPGRIDMGRPRLPVDRVFTITGFGTVVTGTLQDGKLRVGQEVQVFPGEQRTRIRGLQEHKQAVEEGSPGGRLAANLVGVAKSEIARGDVLALPGTLRPTAALDVRLDVISGAPRSLPHNAELELYAGAAEVPIRVLLLDKAELQPGSSGWAQLRLRRPLALLRGDRFIVRVPSPSMTIGGGVVVEPWARRHRRFDAAVLERLEQLALPDPEEVILATLRPDPGRRAGGGGGRYHGRDAQEISRQTGIPEREIQEAVTMLATRRAVVQAGTFNLLSSEWESLSADAARVVADYHQRYPLRVGMPREEWRSRLDLPARAGGEILAALVGNGTLAEASPVGTDGKGLGGGSTTGRSGSGGGGHGAFVKLPSHQPHMTSAEEQEAAAMLERFRRDPYSPPTRPEVEEVLGTELTMALVDQGKLLRVSETILLEPSAYQRAIGLVVGYLREHETITVAQARDVLGTTRKYMLAILEHLDERRITRRQGDDRTLGPNAPAVQAGDGTSAAKLDTGADEDEGE